MLNLIGFNLIFICLEIFAYEFEKNIAAFCFIVCVHLVSVLTYKKESKILKALF